jgi:hypothetical protein
MIEGSYRRDVWVGLKPTDRIHTSVVVDEINNLVGGVAPAGQKLAQRTARHILGYGASSDIAALRQRKREMVDRY